MKLFTHKDIERSQDLECDVCIIGSGAGGSPLAAGLTKIGANVIMLEAGSYQDAKTFNMNEAKALRDLYQEGGLRATSDLGISILQGRGAGGDPGVRI